MSCYNYQWNFFVAIAKSNIISSFVLVKIKVMSNFFEELKKYFEVTPPEKLLKDWDKSVEFDNIGPTIDEFLSNSKCYFVCSSDPNDQCQQSILNNFSPKFSSGFFLTNYNYTYASCSVFNSQLSI